MEGLELGCLIRWMDKVRLCQNIVQRETVQKENVCKSANTEILSENTFVDCSTKFNVIPLHASILPKSSFHGENLAANLTTIFSL